jgi:hypothetical protein
MMTKQEAQEKDAQIIQLSGQYIDIVGPIVLEMREREGWRALGFKNWTNYCQHVDERISAVNVMRLAQKAEVEQNVQARLPMRHALVLARLPSPEAQREVFKEVKANVAHPIERNYQTYVDRWLRKHECDAPRRGGNGRDDSDGWTKGDLDEDGELAAALDRIESVYSSAERKAIQNGTIGLSRKDIIDLAAFHASKMKEVRNLIMSNHWDLATAMKFVSSTPSDTDKILELHNHCLATPGLYYTISINGFDHQVKACKAITNKINGQANDLL